MRHLLRSLGIITLAMTVVGVSSAPATAAPIAFAVTTESNLYTVDLATGTATLIGGTGVFLESIAFSSSGQLFGASSSGILYSLNTLTGLATLIGDTGLGNIEALDFNGETLVGINFTDTPTAYSIDTATAAPTSIVTAGAATGLVRAGTIQDANTMLIRGDGGLGCGGECLFSLNLTTGAVALIGNMAGVGLIPGLDFAGGVLYGLSSSGQTFSVNTGNGAVTTIGAPNGLFYLGMATQDAAIPEPATMALVGSGVLVALARRRRKA